MIRFSIFFLRQMGSLLADVPKVFFFIKRLQADEVAPNHPWVTGEIEDGTYVWPRNIVFRSSSSLGFGRREDEEAVTKVGMFLRSMVKRSVRGEEVPHGPKRRMPHAVNYIHGSVHYNGAFAIFDDDRDLVAHLQNRAFRRAFRRFVKEERREVTIVLRDRTIDATQYAFCVAAVRAYLPYFTNGNGPTDQPVLWGNKSPYFALNPINGAWSSDLEALRRGDDVVRAPIVRSYFDNAYSTSERDYYFLERLYAWLMFVDVRARGFRGNIFFCDRADFEPKSVEVYRETGYWRWYNIARVPHPFRKPRAAAEKVTVVIPTLNEGSRLLSCLQSVDAAFDDVEIIVVDGGSCDTTREIAAKFGARVAFAPKSRGAQLRFGAKLASNELLCFLHADASLAPSAGRVLRRHFANRSNQICTLRLRFDKKTLPYRLLGWATRLDGFVFSYGDQGIVVRRELYDRIGGFSALPNFEDVDFLRRARRVARIRSARTKVRVSARRFERNGLFRELALNSKLMTQLAVGADPIALHHKYANRPAKQR